MTKARDLANASTALSAVDATELGYLDGVTSNIQTQFGNISGSKAQPTEPASPTDGMIWVDTDGAVTDAQYIAKNVITTTGDIIYASGANTPARLGIGSTGQVLKVNGGVPTWGADGGKVLQVVSANYGTEVTTTSSSFVDTGLSLAITPTLSTSKVLVIISQHLTAAGTSGDGIIGFTALRGATTLFANTYGVLFNMGSTNLGGGNWGYTYLDSPATTSSTTYKTQFRRISASGNQTAQFGSAQSTITLLEIGA